MQRNQVSASTTAVISNAHFDQEFDARYLSCPLPILNTRNSVQNLLFGEVLKIVSNDKGCVSFFESLIRQTGLELIDWSETAGDYTFYLRKN